jgi:hypothetical protein
MFVPMLYISNWEGALLRLPAAWVTFSALVLVALGTLDPLADVHSDGHSRLAAVALVSPLAQGSFLVAAHRVFLRTMERPPVNASKYANHERREQLADRVFGLMVSLVCVFGGGAAKLSCV